MMSFRRNLNRVKKNILSNLRHWSRNGTTIEKIAALSVIICVVFILVCNHVLQTPVQLKSPDICDASIRSGILRNPQDDWRIVKIAKSYYIEHPKSRKPGILQSLQENYIHPEINKITDYVLKLSQNKTAGFFVEYPAKDGVINSQTIQLEKLFNWTGLLIEHDPKFVYLLEDNLRFCFSSDACLSVNKYPKLERRYESASARRVVTLFSNKTDDSSSSFNTKDDLPQAYFVQCFPLYTMLLTINAYYVDFLSLRLDDAATSLAILKTLPFKDSWMPLLIKIISVDVPASSKEYQNILQFLTSQDYILSGYIKGSSEADNSKQVYIHESEFKTHPNHHTHTTQ